MVLVVQLFLLLCCIVSFIPQVVGSHSYMIILNRVTNSLYNYGLLIRCILYNYRLLMRSTRYHVDRVWYWLNDAEGRGLPIPDKVPSRPKSKVYNCLIKLSGILLEIDFNHKEISMALSGASKNRREMRCVYCDVIRKCTPNSPV